MCNFTEAGDASINVSLLTINLHAQRIIFEYQP